MKYTQVVDGKTYSIDGPQGASPDEVKAKIREKLSNLSQPSRLSKIGAGVGQFALPLAGMVAGGAGGGTVGSLGGPVGSIAGGIAGAGAGSAGMQKVADIINKELGVPVPETPTKLLGIPLPKNRYVQAATLGAIPEGLGMASKAAFASKAPSVLRTALDIPEQDTQLALKVGKSGLQKGMDFIKSGGYSKATERLRLPSLAETTDKFIEEGVGKATKASKQANQMIANIKLAMTKNPKNAGQYRNMLGVLLKEIPDMIDPSKRPQLDALTSTYRVMRDMASDETLVKAIGPEHVMSKLLQLRNSVQGLVKWEAPREGLANAKAYEDFVQNVGKKLYGKVNSLIERVPGGEIIREADKMQRLGYVGKELSQVFKRPTLRETGGVAKLGGLGFAPFILSRMTGLPLTATYGGAIASRSPILAREAMFSTWPYSVPISALLRSIRQRQSNTPKGREKPKPSMNQDEQGQ